MAKAINAARAPYRAPSARLTGTVTFSRVRQKFLNNLKPWNINHWSKSFGTPQDHILRDKIKAKIKTQLELIQDNYCAFCGLNLELLPNGTHREHIAPQSQHLDYIFEPQNLVLACSYCNNHKGKKRTITTPAGNYGAEIFNILHPHRDDFNQYLRCDIPNFDLIFTIIDPAGGKTQRTIECVGLAIPHLITQRGAIILKVMYNNQPAGARARVNQILTKTRKRKK